MKQNKTLSDLQMEIMRILWKFNEASVAEVHQMINRKRPLATTTVSTLLSRLEKRGLVSHRNEGRQYFYKPEVSEQEVRRSMIGDLVTRLFKGDFKALVNHLVSESEISEEDLDNLKSYIADKERREQNQ